MNILQGGLLLFVLFLPIFAQQNLPFCTSVCTCTNETEPNVSCQKISPDTLFGQTLWINASGDPYPYGSLSVRDSEIEIIDKEFPNSTIKSLNLANNLITVINDGVFKNLQSMSELSLSHNRLNKLSPDTFKGYYKEETYMPLRSMKILRLDHNNIFDLNSDIFEHIQNLELLDLSYNPLKVLTKDASIAISSLQSLKELYLTNTEIHELPEYFLHTQRKLEVLDLSENPITTIPATLKYSDSLSHLYLNRTEIKNLDEKNCFPEMPHLKVLHMCHIETITNISRNAMSGLTNLEELYLCDNLMLEQIDPMALGQEQETGGTIYPPIRKLHLENNKLSTIAREMIASWDLLSDLDIRGNVWACECNNQWLISTLIPIYENIVNNKTITEEVVCGSPVEMRNKSLYNLFEKNYEARCLDVYGARPENDAMMLVGVLAGVLMSLPIILFIMYSYQRNWFGLLSSSPAAYSRQFYRNTRSTDDDEMF